MLVSPLQPHKAPLPMLVTLSGIVMLVRLVQSRKASSPMLVTGLPLYMARIIKSVSVRVATPCTV